MVFMSLTLRLPAKIPSVRRISRARSALAIGFASFVLTLLPLRLLLAAAGIAQWTTSWRVVELLTVPFVAPFELVDPLTRTLLGNISFAEVLATGIFGFLALYSLALLTVRRRR